MSILVKKETALSRDSIESIDQFGDFCHFNKIVFKNEGGMIMGNGKQKLGEIIFSVKAMIRLPKIIKINFFRNLKHIQRLAVIWAKFT